jgi:hypothetical protein
MLHMQKMKDNGIMAKKLRDPVGYRTQVMLHVPRWGANQTLLHSGIGDLGEELRVGHAP